MAPVSHKRRRAEDEVRKPKKKIHVKRQKHYHSSSEDEDEDRPVVSDAPVNRAVEGKPKGILKVAQKKSPPGQPEAAASLEEEDSDRADEVGMDPDETAMNTALNAAPAEDSDTSSSITEVENADHPPPAQDAPSTEESELSSSESDTPSNPNLTKLKKKRNDPAAFATSITRILSTKLTTSKRTDPVLARSATAQEANTALADSKLEAAAKHQLRAEKRSLLEKGRVRDVLGVESSEVSTGAVQEEEKRLKKVAQRGVVRLFNAVRAAQVRAERGEEIVRGEGVVGTEQRRERVGEMSKEGFLELISRGGGENVAA